MGLFLKRNRKIMMTVFFLSLFMADRAFGWMAPKISIDNELTGRETKVEIEEEFKNREGGKPGAVKKISFKNTGDSDIFLRMTYAEYWNYEDEQGEKWQLSNTAEDGSRIARKVFGAADGGNGEKPDEVLWEEGKDGWYYCKKVLPPGSSIDNVLLEVEFPENFTESQKNYENARYHLYFKAEAVQASTSEKTQNRDEVNAKAVSRLFGPFVWAEVEFSEEQGGEYPVKWHLDEPYQEEQGKGGGSD